MNTESYPCPCCGFMSFSEPGGSYEICPICFWEDDAIQLAFPNLAGGANRVSLIEAQKNFHEQGVCEPAMKANVRKASEDDDQDLTWEPYDPLRHRGLDWNSRQDHELWDRVKNTFPNLYYWSPDFWRYNNAEHVVGGNGG